MAQIGSRKKKRAVDCLWRARRIGEANPIDKIRVKPHHDSVPGPGSLDLLLQIPSNIPVFNAVIIERGPELMPSQKLGRAHTHVLRAVHGELPRWTQV